MASERFIDLQLIKPLTKGSGIKGKVSLTNLFKEYFNKLNVGYVDPCCPVGSDNAYGCPAISEDDGNSLECRPNGLYSAATLASGPGGADTNVQFNDAGTFGGVSNFAWDNSTKTLGITNNNAGQQATVSLLNDLANYFRIRITGSTNSTPNTAIMQSDKAINVNSAVYINLNSPGVFVGVAPSFPSAKIHIEASSGAVNTAPIKLTAGTLITLPEAGAIEFDGTHFYGSIGSTRVQLDNLSGVITAANNGITNTSGTVGLGGSLTSSPTITAGSNVLTLTGTRTNFNQPALQLTNNSGGAALQITGTGIPAYINVTGGAGSYGLYIQQLGTSQNADAARFEASGSAKALELTAIGGTPLAIYSTPTGTLNTATEIMRLTKNTVSTTDGNGMYISMFLNSSSGPGGLPTCRYEGVLTDSSAGGLATQMNFYTYGTSLATGTNRAVLSLKGTGQMQTPLYGVGTYTGTYARSIAVDAVGNHIEVLSPVITSGTAAPATTPGKVGDIFVDTTGKKMYIATGNASSADWTITN